MNDVQDGYPASSTQARDSVIVTEAISGGPFFCRQFLYTRVYGKNEKRLRSVGRPIWSTRLITEI